MATPEVLKEVEEERSRQDRIWGQNFDDQNNPYNWAAYITHYATRHLIGDPALVSTALFREAMVKTAALAVAAVESIDRTQAK